MSVAFCGSSRLDQEQCVVCNGTNIHILHRCSQIRTVTGGLGSFLGLPDIEFLVYFHFFFKSRVGYHDAGRSTLGTVNFILHRLVPET